MESLELSETQEFRKMELFLSDSRGIYIPKDFAESISKESIAHNSQELLQYLEELKKGADIEDYWDIWNDLLNNLTVINPETGEQYHLHQDGDLFLVQYWEDDFQDIVDSILTHQEYFMRNEDYIGMYIDMLPDDSKYHGNKWYEHIEKYFDAWVEKHEIELPDNGDGSPLDIEQKIDVILFHTELLNGRIEHAMKAGKYLTTFSMGEIEYELERKLNQDEQLFIETHTNWIFSSHDDLCYYDMNDSIVAFSLD